MMQFPDPNTQPSASSPYRIAGRDADEPIWKEFFLAILTSGATVEESAFYADKARNEYRKRFPK